MGGSATTIRGTEHTAGTGSEAAAAFFFITAVASQFELVATVAGPSRWLFVHFAGPRLRLEAKVSTRRGGT